MNIFGKPLDNVEENDLNDLIKCSVRESKILDYKLKCELSTGDKKKEFLYDVSSFANTDGGVIIYGIKDKQKNKKNTGEPEEIVGIGNVNFDQEQTRIENIIRTGIEPKIIGIKFKDVKCLGNRSVSNY